MFPRVVGAIWFRRIRHFDAILSQITLSLGTCAKTLSLIAHLAISRCSNMIQALMYAPVSAPPDDLARALHLQTVAEAASVSGDASNPPSPSGSGSECSDSERPPAAGDEAQDKERCVVVRGHRLGPPWVCLGHLVSVNERRANGES